MAPQKALESIGKTLSSQYERWQPKVGTHDQLTSYLILTFESIFSINFFGVYHQARYKCQLDPTVDEVKKLCTTCRKYAKMERVLFHYNGHGVPRPTANGEIWVFNKVEIFPFVLTLSSIFERSYPVLAM